MIVLKKWKKADNDQEKSGRKQINVKGKMGEGRYWLTKNGRRQMIVNKKVGGSRKWSREASLLAELLRLLNRGWRWWCRCWGRCRPCSSSHCSRTHGSCNIAAESRRARRQESHT